MTAGHALRDRERSSCELITELPRRSALLLAGVVVVLQALHGSAGGPTLADAAKSGDLEAVRTLLRQRTDVNASGGDGMTALHWGAYRDDREIAKYWSRRAPT